MATADASIYQAIRPFTMESPIAQAGQALKVQNMQQQVQEGQRKFQLEDDISKALSESGGDYGKASALLAQRGRGTAAISLADKATTKRKADVEEKLKIAEAMGSDAITLDSAYRSALAQAGGDQAAAVAALTPVYQQVRSKWAGLGHQLPEQFDPVSNFAGIGQAKELTAYLKSIAPDVKMTDTGGAVTPVNTNPMAGAVGPLPGAAAIPKTAKPMEPTELARLQAERDALPQGDPRRAQYDRVLASYKAGKGDTNVMVNTGPMAPGKQAANKVDENLIDTTRNLMQLDTIASQFKPEYQRFQDKAGFMALKMKDSSVGLNNKEKQDLTEFSQYRRNAFNTLNEYIKSITGAAMSEKEAERILKALPNPGSGMFDGDSPTEFKAKLDDAMKSTKMAVARLAYMKRNGMSLEDGKGNPVIPLERMPALMNERGKEIETELKAKTPGTDQKALQRAVRRQLSVEFGLSAD